MNNRFIKAHTDLIKSKKNPNIWLLENIYSGKDIYIVGSGKSIDFLPKDFFYDKIIIGVNYVYKKIPCNYIVTVHHEVANEAHSEGQIVITSQKDRQIENTGTQLNKEIYTYKHVIFSNTDDVNIEVLDKRSYCLAGATSVIPAMNIAKIFGAKNIILCGVDCGIINGEANLSEYRGKADYSKGVLLNNEKQIIKVANHFRKTGIGVYSINPFINFGLEGNKYEKEKNNDKPNIFKRIGLFNGRQ